jgi:hypothetical protein
MVNYALSNNHMPPVYAYGSMDVFYYSAFHGFTSISSYFRRVDNRHSPRIKIVPKKRKLSIIITKRFYLSSNRRIYLLSNVYSRTYYPSAKKKKLPAVILLMYAVLIIALFYWFMKTKKWLTIPNLASFGIGDYCALSFTALFVGFKKGSHEIIITAIVFIIIFVLMILYINLRGNNLNLLTKQSTGPNSSPPAAS